MSRSRPHAASCLQAKRVGDRLINGSTVLFILAGPGHVHAFPLRSDPAQVWLDPYRVLWPIHQSFLKPIIYRVLTGLVV